MGRIRQSVARFHRETEGTMTVYGMFIFLSMGCLVGLTVDVSNAYKARSEMQVAADSAAHTALLYRLRDGKQGAINRAVSVANYDLATTKAPTTTITASDITYGNWDRDAQVFSANATPINAVSVRASRTHERANPLDTIFLGLTGFDAWDINVVSVMETYRPPCLREGFAADDTIDIQSNNGFASGFCIHSNSAISINQNNFFEAGTIVSMPDLNDLDVAASGFVKNDGLLEALRESFYKIRIVNRINDINTALSMADLAKLREYTAKTETATTGGITYLTQSYTVTVDTATSATKNQLSPGQLTQGAVNIVKCQAGKTLTFERDQTFSNVAILTSCPVQISSGVHFEDMILSTTDTSVQSIKGPSGGGGNNINFGRDDNCAEGGGSHLVTLGGIQMAASMNVYGSQFLAAGDIQFAANAEGIEGISLVSGGRIDGTSNMKMGFCGTGMSDNFEVDYYRLAL